MNVSCELCDTVEFTSNVKLLSSSRELNCQSPVPDILMKNFQSRIRQKRSTLNRFSKLNNQGDVLVSLVSSCSSPAIFIPPPSLFLLLEPRSRLMFVQVYVHACTCIRCSKNCTLFVTREFEQKRIIVTNCLIFYIIDIQMTSNI